MAVSEVHIDEPMHGSVEFKTKSKYVLGFHSFLLMMLILRL